MTGELTPPPESPQAARLLLVERGGGTSADITSFSKKGCYVGETVIRPQQGRRETLLHPEEEIFMTVKARGVACSGFSFVPETGAAYELAIGVPKGADANTCAWALSRVQADGGRSPVKTRFFFIKMGRPGCLRAGRDD